MSGAGASRVALALALACAPTAAVAGAPPRASVADYLRAQQLEADAKKRERAGDLAGALAAEREAVKLDGSARRTKYLATLDAAWAKTVAKLRVEVSEPGAEIAIDGAVVGVSPLADPRTLAPGTHVVRATKQGFEPVEVKQEVTAGAEASTLLTLEPEVKTAELSVRAEEDVATRVVVDGEDLGATPWRGTLPAGEHVLVLRGDRHASRELALKLVRGRSYDLEVRAEARKRAVRLTVHPDGSELVLDGKKRGGAGFRGELSFGTHTWVATAPDHVQRSGELDVDESTSDLDVTLALSDDSSAARKARHVGVYGGFSLSGMTFAEPGFACAENGCVWKRDSLPMAAGATFRVGRSWGTLGLEGVASGFAETYALTNDGSSIPKASLQTEHFSMRGAGAFVGVGVRASSRGDAVRVTSGLALGGAYRVAMLTRDQSFSDGTTSSQSLTASKVVPGAILDAAVLFGRTPGWKLALGAMLWIDAPASAVEVVPDDGTHYVVFPSLEWFVGPTLGVVAGH